MNKTVLNPYSYHVFKFMDKAILYDLNTDSITQVDDDFTFALLELAGQCDMSNLRRELAENHDNVDEDKIMRLIKPLKASGFFFKAPPDHKKISKTKIKLMDFHTSQIQLSITQACNLACIYCYAEASGSNAKNKLMSYETAKCAIDYLIANRKDSVDTLPVQFFGGEPLMNFELIKQVIVGCKLITKKSGIKFKFGISTNCTLLTEEVQDFLVENRFSVLLSIDGDEETHNCQRPFRDGRASYKQAIDNALSLNKKFLKNKCGAPRIRANLINGTATQLAKFTEIFTAMGFKSIDVAPIISRPGDANKFALDEQAWEEWHKQSDELLLEWLKYAVKNEIIENSYINRQVQRKLSLLKSQRLYGGVRCGVGRNTNIVDADGNIFPCHRYPGLDKYIIGNIYIGIDRDKVSKYYDGIMNSMLENCGNCWMRNKCGGPCPWQVSANEGNICPSDKFSCDERKHSFKQAAYLYVCLSRENPKVLERMLGEKR